MLGSFAILVISIFITFFELPPLIKDKLFKESVIFCSLLSIGTLLSILISFGIHFPNPSVWLITIMKPLSNFIENLLT